MSNGKKVQSYYLDDATITDLDKAVEAYGVNKSEIVRRGIRLAIDQLPTERPQYSQKGEW